MKLVWTPETASKAYIDTVKSCEINFKESGVEELLSAMAAGWNAKFIVEAWSRGGSIATSIGLAIAARHTNGKHFCTVIDEQSRVDYVKAMKEAGSISPLPEVAIGDAEDVLTKLDGVDFLVVDCKRKDFAKVLRFAKLSSRGAVLACKNAREKNIYGVISQRTRVVRKVFLPVGQGLDIVHVGSSSGVSSSRKSNSRWIKHIDRQSGEEHLFRECITAGKKTAPHYDQT